jgi:hypothetical protein
MDIPFGNGRRKRKSPAGAGLEQRHETEKHLRRGSGSRRQPPEGHRGLKTRRHVSGDTEKPENKQDDHDKADEIDDITHDRLLVSVGVGHHDTRLSHDNN